MNGQAWPRDPAPQDWAGAQLPESWVDELTLARPSHFWRFLRPFVGRPRPVVLPATLPGREHLPDYLLHEFHRLPNGNFSRSIAAGYARWFDLTMLGLMSDARAEMARSLSGARSALDVGCGGGRLAGAMAQAGIADVWGLDPCPYLLQTAAENFPDVRFIQGVAEKTPFPEERFDAAGAAFLFHELPGAVADKALSELHRILKDGGRLEIVEPSPIQIQEEDLWRLLKESGWRGLYFKLLAKIVFDPYVNEWHRKDPAEWLSRHGFALLKDEIGMPLRRISARKEKMQ